MYVLRFQEIIKDLNADLLIVHNACERVIQSVLASRVVQLDVAHLERSLLNFDAYINAVQIITI